MSVGVAAEIKAKLNIVDVVAESVELRKAGTTFKGLCPFHSEKTASFVVTPARESWKCFGCGKGGDIFSFVMERDTVGFPEALRRLAAKAGVELDERTTREDARRKRLHEVLEAAIAFYHQVLTQSRVGQPALDYLRGRGFTDETISGHQLGYAPDAWDVTSRRLIERRGFREEELEAAGLAVRRDRRAGVYDRFRGRIIFPIRDASGAATGLGGRILATPDAAANQNHAVAPRERGPKYLNTPATSIFDKSRTLYLIDRAKAAMRRTGRAVLVEGNTDALMAHQAGFDNVVGTLGTALTPAQIELVTRYASQIALAYDVDSAGQSAATFGATELSALVGEIERSPHRGRLTDVGVVRLPGAKDPDEVIRDDPETWRRATEAPQPIVEYLIERYAERHDPRTVPGRERLVAAVMPTLRTIGDPVRRDAYLQQLARRSGVDERTLVETMRRPVREDAQGRRAITVDGHAGGRINLDAVLATPGALDTQAAAKALEPVESTLLRILLARPAEQARLANELRPEDLVTTPARELWRAILADRAIGTFDRNRFLSSLDPTLETLARALYARTDPLPEDEPAVEQAIEQCLLRLEQRRLAERFDYVRAELAEAEASRDEQARDRAWSEIRALERDRAELDRRAADSGLLTRMASRRATRTTATNEASQPTSERITSRAGGMS